MTDGPARAAGSRTRRIGTVALRVADDQPTFWDRVEAGAWEPGTIALLAREVGPGSTFLDVGAWVGALSLLGAGRGARVVAVEADPVALGQLRRNVAANPGLARQVTIVPRAVAPSPGPVRLGARRKPGDSMSSTLLASSSAVTWTAEAVTPAELAALLPLDGPSLVKIDIEGGEYDLLPHLGPLLDRPGTRLLVSFHPEVLRSVDPARAEVRTRRAIAALAGMASYALEQDGPVRRAATSSALAASDTWLFRRD